ncbi:MAG: thiolase family protein [Actinobacteria bacterium]|nr:thiolase family protein [Actinomycetota bacterium]MCG2818545.1 thiolase family protein [Actinomycetes bacterium]MBU4179816.1 thiolase family protein [Actinomycetota bacterium]MBU4218266.1 thiolase family protein [Actinomycetota bacterium]MBU4358691.1 thiolase family protein [Actinomycetota bacterium]
MGKELRDVYLIDTCRTAFGKARPNGFFAETRADDMVVKIIRSLMHRNPKVEPDMVDDNIWGATTQSGDQGLTMGRTTALLAGLPPSTPGCSVDRMCAGAMTAINNAVSDIAFNAADVIIAGGVEHMGHHPMGQGADPNPRFISEKIVDPSALNMGITAENIHDMYPNLTRLMSDEYAVHSQQKAKAALDAGHFDDVIIPMTVWTGEGWKVADIDEQPRPEATVEGMKGLRLPFRKAGKVTPGNSSGLNDGATGCLMVSAEKSKELGLEPKMKAVGFAYAGVRPEVMGLGPIPATRKVLERTGMSIDDMDFIEVNEAFAVQCLAFIDEFGLDGIEDKRLNQLGGAIAFGHPLASSGGRLCAHLAKLFELNPSAKYGVTTLCVGLGMGVATIWENASNGK